MITAIPEDRYQPTEFYVQLFGVDPSGAAMWRGMWALRHADQLIKSGGQAAVAEFYGAEYAEFAEAQRAATAAIEEKKRRLREALATARRPVVGLSVGGDPESLALEREMGDDIGYREGGGREIYGGEY